MKSNYVSILYLSAAALAHSAIMAHAESYQDDFEAAQINSFWNVANYAGPESVVLVLPPVPVHGGAQSVALSAYAGVNGGGGLWHPFDYDARGSASVWIYDTAPGQETRYCHMTLYYSHVPYGNPGSFFAAGFEDWTSSHYYVTDPQTGHNVSSQVPRSEGWHHFDIRINEHSCEFRIDGQIVLARTGDFQFDSVNLEVFGPSWRPSATFYFDDFSIQTIQAHRGDMNCDGTVNDFDIDAFVMAITNEEMYHAAHPTCHINHADVNGDGAVNNFDIDPFVVCLTGGCS
jgi:hypothetical protein